MISVCLSVWSWDLISTNIFISTLSILPRNCSNTAGDLVWCAGVLCLHLTGGGCCDRGERAVTVFYPLLLS